MTNTKSYRVGDTIYYSAFGSSGSRIVKVTNREDIKGRPGFDGLLSNGEAVWGYDEQITRVVPA